MVGVFVAFIRVVYGRMIYMSLPTSLITICINLFVDSNEDGVRFWRRNRSFFKINRAFNFELNDKVQIHERDNGKS